MSFDAHKNFAYSTVASRPVPQLSGTILVVASGDGAKFPIPPFNATVWPLTEAPLTSNAEIIRVTGISGDILTIVRAQESSSAQPIENNYQIVAGVTSKSLTDLESAITIIQGLLPAGTIVGTSDSQTLTNKTLTSPTLNTPSFSVGSIPTAAIANNAITAAKIEIQQAWQEVGSAGKPAFQNSWVNFGGPYDTTAYMKDSFGFVHLKGMVKAGTIPSVIFTLPSGYIPSALQFFCVLTNNGVGRLNIDNGGNVLADSIDSNVYIILNGVTFKAA